MSTEPEYYIQVNLTATFETLAAAEKFHDMLTGNDDDIVLAAEKAMNEIIGADWYREGVNLDPPSKEDMRALIDETVERHERKKRLALAQLEIDAQISELQIKRKRLVEELS